MDSISVSLSFYIIMKEIIGFLEFLEAGIPNKHWELYIISFTSALSLLVKRVSSGLVV